MQPSRTVHDSGFWLAFQPSSVLPSNMLIQESLSSAAMAQEARSAAAIRPSVSVFIVRISLDVKRHCSRMRRVRDIEVEQLEPQSEPRRGALWAGSGSRDGPRDLSSAQPHPPPPKAGVGQGEGAWPAR